MSSRTKYSIDDPNAPVIPVFNTAGFSVSSVRKTVVVNSFLDCLKMNLDNISDNDVSFFHAPFDDQSNSNAVRQILVDEISKAIKKSRDYYTVIMFGPVMILFGNETTNVNAFIDDLIQPTVMPYNDKGQLIHLLAYDLITASKNKGRAEIGDRRLANKNFYSATVDSIHLDDMFVKPLNQAVLHTELKPTIVQPFLDDLPILFSFEFKKAITKIFRTFSLELRTRLLASLIQGLLVVMNFETQVDRFDLRSKNILGSNEDLLCFINVPLLLSKSKSYSIWDSNKDAFPYSVACSLTYMATKTKQESIAIPDDVKALFSRKEKGVLTHQEYDSLINYFKAISIDRMLFIGNELA